jgi:hypothetical protein
MDHDLSVSDGGNRGRHAGGVTPRAVLVAFGLVALASVGAFYFEVLLPVTRESMNGGTPAPWPVSFLFLLTAIMGLPFLRRVGLTRAELLTVYAIVLIAVPLNAFTVLFYVVPKAVVYYYVGRAEILWQTTFIEDIPPWLGVSDAYAAEAFFVGQASVPWRLWATPLAAWASFMLSLFAATFCLIAVFERQWIRHERLSFPMAQLPLEMVQEEPDDDRLAGRLTRAWPFWIGLIAAAMVGLTGRAAQVRPNYFLLPNVLRVMDWARVGPLAGLGPVDLVLDPTWLAVAYLIPKDVSFSVWFFWLVRIGLAVAAIAAGASPMVPDDWWGSEFPAPYHQGLGALMALGLYVLWTARPHVARVFRALFAGRSAQEADAPLPYRWAAVGLVVCFAWMVIFCWLAGCRVLFGLALMGLIVGSYVMFARLRADAPVWCCLLPVDWLMSVPLGSRALRPAEITTRMMTHWASFPSPTDTFAVCTGNALEGLKIADAAQISKRRLTAAVAVALLLSLVLGMCVLLLGIYHYGYYGTAMGLSHDWPAAAQIWDGNGAASDIASPAEPDSRAMIALAVGAGVFALLGALRLRFLWWPLHPIGYILSCSWGQAWFTFPFLFGWAAKSLVLRYGGLRLYRRSVPLAVGMITGQMLVATLWSILGPAIRG